MMSNKVYTSDNGFYEIVLTDKNKLAKSKKFQGHEETLSIQRKNIWQMNSGK